MDSLECARSTRGAVVDVPSGFMIDPALYQKGAEVGLPGAGIYVAGRAGVLGRVHADVVVAAFGVFHPDMIRTAWDDSLRVMEPTEAARHFAGFSADWAAAHLADGPDYGRVAYLARLVAEAADPVGAPLFAAWRAAAELEPPDPKALALHRLNVLRELRGARHLAAVLAAGLTPLEAVMVKTPFMASIFGWPEPHPDPEPVRDRWEQAERLTEEMTARDLSVLSESELAEFADLCEQVQAAVR